MGINMKYGITLNLHGCTDLIELSQEKFNEIKRAKIYLMHALLIEDKFAYILDNYCEFENELLNLTIKNTVFKRDDYNNIVNNIHTINRRILNLVAVCRMYFDQVIHQIHEVYGKDSHQCREIDNLIKNEYDSNMGYRVLEAIRNHAQHCDVPVSALTYWSKNKKVLIPKIKVSKLKENNEFKKKVLVELEGMGDKLDIRPFIRQYLESIGRIHGQIRQTIKKDILIWEKQIEYVKSQYYEYGGKDILGLCIVARDAHGIDIECIEIFDDFINRRKALEKSNPIHIKFASDHVSNEIIDE
jgi:hypothetical protein